MKRPAVILFVLYCGAAFAQAIPGVVAADAKAHLVQDKFVFPEGPVPTADGGLYFSDIFKGNKTYRMDPSGKISIFRQIADGSNGLALMRDGTLIAAEGDAKLITKVAPDGTATILTDGTASQPLLWPDDLLADSKGGIYFSDPGKRPLGHKAYTYYLPAGSKTPLEIDSQITRPNGITLTNDEKTLIVDDTVGEVVYAFDVNKDGSVKNKRSFTKVHDIPAGMESGADGIAIDRADRLFVACVNGVQVFDRQGAYLGIIKVPGQPTNIAFGGPQKRTLYITSRDGGLYSLQTLTQGPSRLGK